MISFIIWCVVLWIGSLIPVGGETGFLLSMTLRHIIEFIFLPVLIIMWLIKIFS